jgi:hypothetical protein
MTRTSHKQFTTEVIFKMTREDKHNFSTNDVYALLKCEVK